MTRSTPSPTNPPTHLLEQRPGGLALGGQRLDRLEPQQLDAALAREGPHGRGHEPAGPQLGEAGDVLGGVLRWG